MAETIYQPTKQDNPNKGEQFLEIMSVFDEDFINAVVERDNNPVQEREPL